MQSEQPSLERLFEATRQVERSAHPECLRLRATVAARLSAVGVSFGTSAIAGAASGVGTSASQATWLVATKSKILVGLALLGSASTGGVLAWRAADAREGVPREQQAVPMKPIQPFARSSIASFLTLPKTKGWLEDVTSTPTPQPANMPVGDALAAELGLVRAAQSDLANGQSARAIARLDRYFRRFPAGILQPEARATRVRALCLAGRVAEAEREGSRCAQENPDSPLTARGQSCKAP